MQDSRREDGVTERRIIIWATDRRAVERVLEGYPGEALPVEIRLAKYSLSPPMAAQHWTRRRREPSGPQSAAQPESAPSEMDPVEGVPDSAPGTDDAQGNSEASAFPDPSGAPSEAGAAPDAQDPARWAGVYDDAFLQQAYAMGYTDLDLELLHELDIPEETILRPHKAKGYSIITTTTDGSYSLGRLDTNYMLAYYYVVDNAADTATAICLDNGFSTFGVIDGECFYAGIAQVGGAEYPAGVYVYRFDHPLEPAGEWILESRPDTGETTGESRNYLNTVYYDKASDLIFAAHYEIPESWGGWAKEDEPRYYRITALDRNAEPRFTIETQLSLQSGKMGIVSLNFNKPNAMLEPKDGVVYFDLNGPYALDIESRTVAPVQS